MHCGSNQYFSNSITSCLLFLFKRNMVEFYFDPEGYSFRHFFLLHVKNIVAKTCFSTIILISLRVLNFREKEKIYIKILQIQLY